MTSVPRIAVVGAGCTGSVAALRLAEAGLAPALLERDAAPGDSAACGGVMLTAVARRLALPPEVAGLGIDTMTVRGGRRDAEHRFGGPAFVSFDRGALDRHLAERAAGAGADLRTGCRVRAVEPDAGRVEWERDGRAASETFDLVVLADGPRGLGRGLGLGFGERQPAGAALYRELEAPGWQAPGTTEFHLGVEGLGAGYLWVFPKPGGRVQVGVGRLHAASGEPLRRVLDRFLAADERLHGLPVACTRGGVAPLALGRRLARGRVLVAGDAAGMVNPITGGGLAYAVASGELAARAAVEAGRDGAWAARRYRRLWARSIHRAWLGALAVPFRVLLAAGGGTEAAYGRWFERFARLQLAVTPLATRAVGAGGRG